MPSISPIETEAKAVIERNFSRYFNEIYPFSMFLKNLLNRQQTSEIYKIYRNNYFYRTKTTMPSLAALLLNLSNRGTVDQAVFNTVMETLGDESGLVGSLPMHRNMLEDAHNLHGCLVFEIAPLALADADEAPLILKENKTYRKIQASLYSSSSLPEALGAFVAQEGAAQSMLRMFYESFFRPYEDEYRRMNWDFDRATRYFTSHICGVEQDHARKAMACAGLVCRKPEDLKDLDNGMRAFLKAQSDVWHGLQVALDRELNREIAFA